MIRVTVIFYSETRTELAEIKCLFVSFYLLLYLGGLCITKSNQNLVVVATCVFEGGIK
jgi:hypothetical protein